MDLATTTLLLTLLAGCCATSFSEIFPDWPDHCCQLQLERHEVGQLLPKDTIYAADVKGKRWGYAVDQHQEYGVQTISEKFTEPPVLFKENDCLADKRPIFQVLTNPNKCAIDWYTTRYKDEMFVNSTGVVMGERNEVYLPAFNGYYFASAI